MNNEKGHALPLALLALLVGMLVITPFLTHVSTGVIAGGIYGEAIIAQQSAEAGIEYAIWRLQKGERPPSLHFPLNNKPVNVTIEHIVDRTYKIRSTADRTIIEASVEVGSFWFTAPGLPIVPGSRKLIEEERSHSFYYSGNVTLRRDSAISVEHTDLFIYAGENISLNESEIYSEYEYGGVYVYAGKNISLNEAEIYSDYGRVFVYAGRDIELGTDAAIYAEEGNVYIHAGGKLKLGTDAAIYAEYGGNAFVYARGDIILEGSDAAIYAKDGNAFVYARGDIILEGSDAAIYAEDGDVIVLARGNITLKGSDAAIYAEDGSVKVYVKGILSLGRGTVIGGNVYVYPGGSVLFHRRTQIHGDIIRYLKPSGWPSVPWEWPLDPEIIRALTWQIN